MLVDGYSEFLDVEDVIHYVPMRHVLRLIALSIANRLGSECWDIVRDDVKSVVRLSHSAIKEELR